TATTTGANSSWTIGADHADGGKFKISSSTALGTNDRLVIDGKGRIGIGTSSPIAKLHIIDTTAAATFTGDNQQGMKIQGANTASDYAILGFDGNAATYNKNKAQIGAKFTGIGSYLQFGTSNDYSLGITNTALTIDPTGNVGIGTTNPYLFKLTVAGSIAPSTTNSYDLGGTANYWRRLYATNVSSTNIDATGYVSTTKLTTGIGSISAPSLSFQGDPDTGLYLFDANRVMVASNGTNRFLFGTGTNYNYGNLWPGAHNGYDLGAMSQAWRNLYVSSTSYLAAVNAAGNIIPTANNQYDLGSATLAWRNVYASGTIMTTGDIYARNVTSTGIIYTGATRLTADAGGPLTLIDEPLTATPAAGTRQGYIFAVGSNPFLDMYAQSNGAANGVQNASVRFYQTLRPDQNNLTDVGAYGGAIKNLFVSSTSYLADINAGGTITPRTTLTYDLGTSSNYWRKLFVKNVSSTNIDALGYVSTTSLWVNGTQITGSGSQNLQQVTDIGYVTTKPIRVAGVSSTASILPTVTNSYDLGSSSAYWRKLFATNVSSTNIDVSNYISVPNQTGLIKVGNYGTISETGSSLASISGNAVKASPTLNNTVVKTATDPGQYIKMVYNAGISFHTNLTGAVGTTYDELYNTRMLIGLNGNVGIGSTVQPPNKLTITGTGAAGTAGNADLGFNVTSSASTLSWTMGADKADQGKFKISSSTALGTSDRLVINGKGYVGIGTASPNSLFNVYAAETVGTNRVLANIEGQPVNGGGSSILRVTGGSYATDLEQNQGGTGPFRYGTYIDTNIVNSFNASNGAYGNINFVTGNVGGSAVAMTIGGGTQKGNVGIGTAAPLTKLHVYGVTNASPANGISLQTDNTAGSYTGLFFKTTTDATADYFKAGLFYTSAAEGAGRSDLLLGVRTSNDSTSATPSNSTGLLVQGTTGNIGIGTATPIAQTEIYGTGQTVAALTDAGNRGAMLMLNDSGTAAGNGAALVFGNLQSRVANSIGFAAIKGYLTNGSGNTTGDITFSSRRATTDVALTENMRIEGTTGEVGIGIATPGYLLDVAGSSQFGTLAAAYTARFPTADVTAIGTTPNIWVGARGNINDLAQIGMGYLSGVNPPVIIGHKETAVDGNTKGSIFFATRDVTTDTAPTERMTITSAGYVGIGSTAPSSFKLQVLGDVGPETTATYDLGSPSLRWKNLYASGGIYASGTSMLSVGTPVSSASAINALYVQARGMNLVANGSGLMGNDYNFSAFTYSQNEVHGGLGSFMWSGAYASAFSDELIPVDVSKYYRMVGWAKHGDTGGADYDPTNRQYAGVVAFDIDGNAITPSEAVKYPGSTDTTLTQALNIGDTVMHVADSTGWVNSGCLYYSCAISWWPYTNSKGYTYPNYTYTRNESMYTYVYPNPTWHDGGISGGDITLHGPWPGPALPNGTPVRNLYSGSTYKYITASNTNVPNEWTRYEGFIGSVAQGSDQDANKFFAGTAYVKLMFLPNYIGTGKIRWSDLWLSEMSSKNLEAADATWPGVVSTSTQTFSGNKTFNGYVGVGASPITPLYVQSTSEGAKIDLLTIKNTGSSADTGESILFSNSYRNARITAYSSPGSFYGGKLQLQTHNTANNTDNPADWNTGLFMDSYGAVGIGTTVPGTQLEIGSTNINDRPTASIATINSNFAAANGGGEYDSLILSNGGTDPSTGIRGSALSFKAATYGATGSYSTGRILSYFDTSGGVNPGYAGSVLALQYPTDDNAFTTGMVLRNGDVGINVAAPGAKLQVNKSSTYSSEASAGFKIEDGTSAVAMVMGADVANNNFYIQSLDPGTSYLTRPLSLNPNGGMVGIGTIAPTAPLTVRTDIRFAGDYTVNGAGAVITSATANGGSVPSAAESALLLTRIGVNAQAYSNLVGFNLSRYVNSGINAKTQLDIALNDTTDNPSSLVNIMSLQSGGNVGIGTTAPRSKLEVDSGTANTFADAAGTAASFVSGTPAGQASTVSIESNDAMAADTGGVLGFGGRYITAATGYANWAAIKGLKADGISGQYGGYMSFYTRLTGVGSSERMRIDTNGNVGIGETNPAYSRLHVKLTGAGIQTNTIIDNEQAVGAGVGSDIAFTGNGTATMGTLRSAYEDGTGTNAYEAFLTRGSGSVSEKMRISGAGYVGIGDTSPAAMLTVGNGDLFQVNSTGHVLGIAGTVGAPTYSFTGDPNTGVYSAGANVLGFAIDGSTFATMGNNSLNLYSSSAVAGSNLALSDNSNHSFMVTIA
ncbi:MAG: hypothetical protein M0P61_16180, partial [Ignavibacteriaceae bacterium]|nr:hypothetical protein [Ignavibacteriaceae bacterium]